MLGTAIGRMRRLTLIPALLLLFAAGGVVGAGIVLQARPAVAVPAATPVPLADCFGHKGVQFGTFDAYLCEVKLGNNPSGALYFTPSVDNGFNRANPSGKMLWYKLHAAHDAFYVWENYSDPWGGTYVRANGRIIALDEGPAGQCIVSWPDWTVDPTGIRCVTNGGQDVGPLRPLTDPERYSVAQYQENVRAGSPDSIPLRER